jgi:UDP-N-acetylmuramate: L-alanyl-gamma-D-glutamyl-meso-diaminopimelate ligase
MHIHVAAVGGTFMAGVALLARDLGHRVTGSDQRIYPPMSTQLETQGIALKEGYDASHLDPAPDLVVIGNALSRDNALVEAILERGIAYTSGAQWIADNVLHGRHVLAVAGTHGKTTTASLLAWILEYAGLKPGFMIGGVPENFGVSARLGESPYFVIEADEYDTAFFDKRSKFVHYRPRTVVLNNLEFDHADIFPDLESIQRQFHHLLRTVPRNGKLIVNGADKALADVLEMGCWTPVEYVGVKHGWSAQPLKADTSRFRVLFDGKPQGDVAWDLIGTHNMCNALCAIAAAHDAGVDAAKAVDALAGFRSIKRRLEVRGTINGVTVYDDFAHHPTAIATTLQALRAHVGDARVVAVLELRSNTMRMGVHRDTLAPALSLADRVLLLKPKGLNWNLERVTAVLDGRGQVLSDVDAILDTLTQELRPKDHVLIMSNGGFDNIHMRLLDNLKKSSVTRQEKIG